jgi:hypothetical protein
MNENKWLIQTQFYIIIGLLLTIFLIGYLKNTEIEKLTISYKKTLEDYKNKMLIAEEKIQREQFIIDSLDILLASKQQTIINNNYFYEKQNKYIANLNTTSTDSLYRKNLQSMYSRYGYLLDIK